MRLVCCPISTFDFTSFERKRLDSARISHLLHSDVIRGVPFKDLFHITVISLRASHSFQTALFICCRY